MRTVTVWALTDQRPAMGNLQPNAGRFFTSTLNQPLHTGTSPMTHTKRNRLPQGERALTPIIAGHFPNASPFTALPNNCQADFTTHTSVAEVEPVLRWQHGLGQILEYWTLCLQSLHPILILIDSPYTAARRALRRAQTTCAPLPIQLMIYDPAANKFTTGGPTHHYNERPDWPLLTPAGHPWHAPEYLLRVYDEPRLPYCCWRATYDARLRLATRSA